VFLSQVILPTRKGRRKQDQLEKLAKELKEISRQIGFKLSSRGWCYQLEGFNYITKADFERVERLINECRRTGLLPVDFVAEERARSFDIVEEPTTEPPEQYLVGLLRSALNAEEYYTPDWWEGEQYYIQMLVEKIDLKTLFTPICKDFHIPIATSRGWSAILQRAEYARRFKEAEARGLQSVLLYCGDHDPDGLRISEFLRENLEDLKAVEWGDGTNGYDPKNLIIDRFGLNGDFIVENKLSWIDNLETGSGGDLCNPNHPNHFMEYVQEYIKKWECRKCEANALVVRPRQAEELCRQAIEKYVGPDALSRFESKREKVRSAMEKFRRRSGLLKSMDAASKLVGRRE